MSTTTTEMSLTVGDVVIRTAQEKKGEYTVTGVRRLYVAVRNNNTGKEMLVKASDVRKVSAPAQ